MSDQGQYDSPRRRRPAGDTPAPPPAGDDPMAVLEERLQAMSPGGAPAPATPAPPPEPRSQAAPPSALPAAPRQSRGRRKPAARRRSTFSLARIAAPVVFLVAVVVLVALVFQSGIVGSSSETPTPTPTPKATKTKGGGSGSNKAGTTVAFKKYTVKDGDTLSGIAVKYDTTVNEILALNPDMSTSTLVVGTVVRVPKPSPSPSP
jgi:LysM repeat protein